MGCWSGEQEGSGQAEPMGWRQLDEVQQVQALGPALGSQQPPVVHDYPMEKHLQSPIVIVDCLVFFSSCSVFIQEDDALPSAHPSSVLILYQINCSVCQQATAGLLSQQKRCQCTAGAALCLGSNHTGFTVILNICWKNENSNFSNVARLLV